jgi:hypothetical protein
VEKISLDPAGCVQVTFGCGTGDCAHGCEDREETFLRSYSSSVGPVVLVSMVLELQDMDGTFTMS